jgi:hypothetical protein
MALMPAVAVPHATHVVEHAGTSGSRALTRAPEDRRDRSVPSAPRAALTGPRFDKTIA